MAGAPVLGDSRTRNRSVDGVSAFGDDTMNVWQTLEVISGNNLRKKYHYDGYSDADNVLRTLTTSTHRRDSFADKAKSPQPSKKLAETGRTQNEQLDTKVGQAVTRDVEDKKKRGSVSGSKKKSKSAQLAIEKDERDELLRLSLECTDLVQCSFNIPRISARLERLMGTNVVRLTDRKYMKELRERIDEDYRQQLSNRIKNRAIKELERERNLILTGKTDTIPDELSDDPIFVVNKKANIEIVKRRAKLKTNREKNAELLLRQGVKWERERMYHEDQEKFKQLELAKIRREQRALEVQYREEDAERGLDLLRINDAEWLECEQSLRDFLESERNKMKERSWRIPTPFSSDPLDMFNIIRARQKLRESQKRARNRKIQKGKPKRNARQYFRKAAKFLAAIEVFAAGLLKRLDDADNHVIVYLGDDEASDIPSSSGDPQDLICAETDVKQVERGMEEEMDVDTRAGYLVTKDQFNNLRYDDYQIAQLRGAKNIHELYLIAEKIIIGDVEEEPIVEEENDFSYDDDM